MNIGVCRINLRLPENSSLKGKRQVLKSMMARIRSKFDVAVAEVDDNELWQLTTIGICCINNDRRHANQVLSKVVGFVVNSRFEVEILDYEIEVRRVSTFSDQIHRISVANGDVAEATAECAPALADYRNPCTLREFDAEDFTVSGLFKIAESQSERDGGRWTSIERDGRYGFPTKISYSNQEVIDGWVFWTVTRFEPKP